MSDDIATPETHPGSNAHSDYQRAFDSLGPQGSTLLYDHVQLALQKSLSTLVAEMKKKFFHLVKRRLLVEQHHLHLTNKTLPSNLSMKLAAHNFPTTIDEGLVARHNHAEQHAWATFKENIFIQRSELIVADLASLEKSFSLYSDTDYLKERFLKLAPAIRPHVNVINGLVLSFSVTHSEVVLNPTLSSKKKRASTSSSNVSTTTSCANSDDGMTIDESSSSSHPDSSFSSTITPATHSSSSNSSSSSSSSSSSAAPRVSLQQQIIDLTKLVQLSLGKNHQGVLSQPERQTRSTSPATPHRVSRLPSTPGSQGRSPLTQESTFIRTPGKKDTPFQGKSAMKLIPSTFPTNFPPLATTPGTPVTHMTPMQPSFYVNQYGGFNPHSYPSMYGHQPAYPPPLGYPLNPSYPHTQFYSGIPPRTPPPPPPTTPPPSVTSHYEGTPDFAKKKGQGNRGKRPKASIRFAPWNPQPISY